MGTQVVEGSGQEVELWNHPSWTQVSVPAKTALLGFIWDVNHSHKTVGTGLLTFLCLSPGPQGLACSQAVGPVLFLPQIQTKILFSKIPISQLAFQIKPHCISRCSPVKQGSYLFACVYLQFWMFLLAQIITHNNGCHYEIFTCAYNVPWSYQGGYFTSRCHRPELFMHVLNIPKSNDLKLFYFIMCTGVLSAHMSVHYFCIWCP